MFSHVALSIRLGLLVTGQHIIRAFPGREEIKLAEFLRQFHRLIDNPFQRIVIAHLGKAGGRKILAQRMAVKTVIGQQAAQVRVTGEENAVKIIGLALKPQRAGNTSVSEATGVVSSVCTLRRMRWLCLGLRK